MAFTSTAVPLTRDAFTLVASNTTSKTISVINPYQMQLRHYEVPTGDPAPTVLAEAPVWCLKGQRVAQLPIDTADAVDVYVYAESDGDTLAQANVLVQG